MTRTSATARPTPPGGPLVVVGILAPRRHRRPRGLDDAVATTWCRRSSRPRSASPTTPRPPCRRSPAVALSRRTAPRRRSPRRRPPRRHRRPPTAPPTPPPTTVRPTDRPDDGARRDRPRSPRLDAARRRPFPTVRRSPSSSRPWPPSPTPLTTPEAVRPQIDQLLADPRHDVAGPGDVAALCAVGAARRPDRRRRPVGARRAPGLVDAIPSPATAPGFGECVGNDGDALEDGSYQYIATDADGDESAAGGFVVGAARIDQRFSTTATTPICGVRIAPSTSRYFEVYVFDVEPVAARSGVHAARRRRRQDVETMSAATTSEVVAVVRLRPRPDDGPGAGSPDVTRVLADRP